MKCDDKYKSNTNFRHFFGDQKIFLALKIAWNCANMALKKSDGIIKRNNFSKGNDSHYHFSYFLMKVFSLFFFSSFKKNFSENYILS